MHGVPERRLRDCRDSSYFLRFAKNITSQGGEDGIFEELFRLIGTSTHPFCVDIGAWDGQHLSNTYSLVHGKGWGGLLVEANAERLNVMKELYSGRNDVTCLGCLVDIDGESSLQNILNQNSVPNDLDFLSIDVDGADYHLWDTVGKQFQARVVCIEFNPTIPNHVHFVQSRDIAVQEGSSLLALVELGRSFGYHVVVTTTFNAIFVRQDLLHLLPSGIFTYLPDPDNKLKSWSLPSSPIYANVQRTVDLNSLHNCAMATDIFQTYSGELKLCGPKKLLWHRVSMNIQQMQAIKPKKDRVFPFAPPYQHTIASIDGTMRRIATSLVTVMNESAGSQPFAISTYTENIDRSNTSSLLSSSLQKLIVDCRSILPMQHEGSCGAVGKKPLQSIAEEVLLNAVAMAVIAHRHLTMVDCTSEINRNVPLLLWNFIADSAKLCSAVGSGYLEHSGNVGKAGMEGMVAEARVWLLRALYQTGYMLTCHHLAPGNNQVTKDMQNDLTLKLSSCNLLSCSGVSYNSLFRPVNCASDPEGVQCSVPAEEVDVALQGLFWMGQLECLNSCINKNNFSSGGEASDNFSNRVMKLEKKWNKKLMWRELSNDTVINSENTTTGITPPAPYNKSTPPPSSPSSSSLSSSSSSSVCVEKLPLIAMGLSFLMGSALTASVILYTLRNKH